MLGGEGRNLSFQITKDSSKRREICDQIQSEKYFKIQTSWRQRDFKLKKKKYFGKRRKRRYKINHFKEKNIDTFQEKKHYTLKDFFFATAIFGGCSLLKNTKKCVHTILILSFFTARKIKNQYGMMENDEKNLYTMQENRISAWYATLMP